MDVKSLLNEEEPASRPSLKRFGTFKPHQSSRSAVLGEKPHPRHQLPPLKDEAPPPQLRSLSYSSSCSSSCNSSSSSARLPPSDCLPPISSRVPALVRSESGGSQSPHSPATPSGTPNSSPTQRLENEPLRVQSSTKSLPFINLPLPRPQVVSTSSFSAAPSGPPSSMDSFATTPSNFDFADLSFAYSTAQPLSSVFTPLAPLPGPPEPQPTSTSPPSSSSHNDNPAANTSSSSKTPQKRNSYPCPLARQYGCNEHFTTSGHAARHAKKHTGKKDAICPECSKAFTRKDNMEQHRRTHTKDATTRSSSKGSSEKDDSRQRKLMKLQQQKKSRPSSISESSNVGIAAAPPPPPQQPQPQPQPQQQQQQQLPASTNTPSASSTVTSPTTTSYPPSSAGPLQMDGTLDPRLRESPSSVNSGSVSAFSPAPFTPAAFSISDTNPQIYPQNFNPVFSPQSQMSLPQQLPQQGLPQHPINMAGSNPLVPSLSPTMDSFPQRSLHRGSYSNSLDYRLQGSPTDSPLSNLPDGLGLNMPLSMPGSLPLDMSMAPHMGAIVDSGQILNPLPVGMMSTPVLAAGGPGGDPAPMVGMPVAPAFDRLSLDKLALAAEAARNNGN